MVQLYLLLIGLMATHGDETKTPNPEPEKPSPPKRLNTLHLGRARGLVRSHVRGEGHRAQEAHQQGVDLPEPPLAAHLQHARQRHLEILPPFLKGSLAGEKYISACHTQLWGDFHDVEADKEPLRGPGHCVCVACPRVAQAHLRHEDGAPHHVQKRGEDVDDQRRSRDALVLQELGQSLSK